ncbi:hypothetical protein [Embleya sp. NPDC059259]|uniref:hypothetical protein n=1 Tax=unclassified Embleya TaxID=2699296 RepID=UPI0036B91E01
MTLEDYSPDECRKHNEETVRVTPKWPHVCWIFTGLENHCQSEGVAQQIHEACKGLQQYNEILAFACCKFTTTNKHPVLRLEDIDRGKDGGCRYFDANSIHDDCAALNTGLGGSYWQVASCVCCCACMAYGTPIATPEGDRAIESIARSEQVLAGSLSGDGVLSWRPTVVTFSDGSEGGTNHTTVHLTFGADAGVGGELVCSADQPVLVRTGGRPRWVQASRIHVDDTVVTADGAAIPVRSVAVGAYTGGVHHIGTDEPSDESTDGHLLTASGIVVGDYYLQLRFDDIPDDAKVEDLEDRPHIWTPAYARRHERHRFETSVAFATVAGHRPLVEYTGSFTAYQTRSDYAQAPSAALFTPEQAADIQRNGEQLNLTNPIRKAEIEHLFRHLTGFYPDIVFHLDWYTAEPNVHAVRQYGRKIVVVTGGLARTTALGHEGLLIAIAHGIQRHEGDRPLGTDGFLAVGAADHLAFALTSRTYWWPTEWPEAVPEALEQFEKLFSYVTEENAAGDPAHPLDAPSLHCRLSAMKSGAALGGLPVCAGGAPAILLALEQARAVGNLLTLTFNTDVDPVSSGNPHAYTIDPPVDVTPERDPHSGLVVRLTGVFETDRSYTVTAHDLTSVAGAPLDPGHHSRTFTPAAAAG